MTIDFKLDAKKNEDMRMVIKELENLMWLKNYVSGHNRESEPQRGKVLNFPSPLSYCCIS